MTPRSLLALPLLTLTLAAEAAPPDAAAGKQRVDEHCQSCHKEEIYTRPERKMTNRNRLRNQVQRCEMALGLQWFDSDIEDVTHYLDQQYYRFGQGGG